MRHKFQVSAIGHARRRRQNRKSRKPWLRRLAVWSGILVVLFLARSFVVLILLQIVQFVLTPVLPDIDDAEALYASQSTIIYDREGSELYTIHGDENRFEIPLEKMPENVKMATVAAEDDNFFRHSGFDVNGIARAIFSELGVGRASGGSTITQQFVKNAYLSPERTYWRKLQELLLALKLENKFSKEEILEMYLNRIPYGSNAYGIQAAAQTFFAKNAEDLTLAESVVLAALPQAPSRYSPYGQNRDGLMGSCGKLAVIPADAIVSEAEPAPLQLTATGTVWLRVSVDGEKVKEWTTTAGETQTFPFTENFNIVSGNDNFTLSVGGVEIENAGRRNFTVSRAEINSPPTSAEVKTGAEVKTEACRDLQDPDYAPGRKDYVLGRMLDLGFVTQAEYKTAWQEANNLKFTKYREPIRAPHFVFFVREQLEDRYGKDIVERGGLRVFTTLDQDLQTKAEELIANAFPHEADEAGGIIWSPNRSGASNAALLAIDNATGQILAMVGSRDYFEVLDENGLGNDGATNLTTRNRQPGSSFKPFVYTAGLQAGYTPASVFWDVETNFGRGTDEYTPQNYDGEFLGPLSLRRALGHSRNIPAVKMAILAGELAVVRTAHALGLTSVADDERYGPTIGLGSVEVPMLEMIRGYSVFANSGRLIQPTPFLKITDSRGNLIDEFEKPSTSPVLDPAIAYLVTHILSDPSARPTGWNSILNLPNRPNGAKTGTANKRISETEILPGDVWTIGFTPQITAAVWLGNNNGTPMKVSATGLMTAGPIWRDFMKYAHTDLPVKNFALPKNIVQRSVSRLTGKIASDTTPVDQITAETFASFAVPLEVDDAFIRLTIDAASGKLPTEYTPDSAKVQKTFSNLHSERPHDPEWETPVREWLQKSTTNKNTVLSPPPTEFDDLHNAQTAAQSPTVSIVSPISGSTVQKQIIGVWVDVVAPHGVEKVEYYRNGSLFTTSRVSPWKGVLAIPLQSADGSKHTITAKIYDKLFYTDTSSVEVIVGDDTQIPTVRISAPLANQQIPRGTTLLAKAEAFDAGGDIARVIFYLDGLKLNELTQPPYELPVAITSDIALGTHSLRVKAVDTAGFTATKEVSFRVGKNKHSVTFAITIPADNTKFPAGTAKIKVQASIFRSEFTPTKIEFIARNRETGDRVIFGRVENPVGENFSTTWSGFAAGNYEIYFKARDATGKTITSGRNRVSIGN